MPSNTRDSAEARISGNYQDGWVVHTTSGARFSTASSSRAMIAQFDCISSAIA